MDYEKAFRAKVNLSLWYPRAVNEMRMFKAAAEKANSIDPVKVAAALEDLKFEVLDGGQGIMRKDDHQFFQPIYISSFGKLTESEPFDEEKHRLGLASGLQDRHAAGHGLHDLQDGAAVITTSVVARGHHGPREGGGRTIFDWAMFTGAIRPRISMSALCLNSLSFRP